MADQKTTTYVIIEIDHESEDSNVQSPLGAYRPVGKILFLHNSMDKAENKLIAILNSYKDNTEHKYVLEYKASRVCEVKRVDEGWLSTSKMRVKTIQLCEYTY
jgi:hypothetical protein